MNTTRKCITLFYFKLIPVLFILRFQYSGVEVNYLLCFFNSSSCDLLPVSLHLMGHSSLSVKIKEAHKFSRKLRKITF